MKGRAIRYDDAELAWLEANRLLPIGEYALGFAEAFGRTVDARNLHALRKRKGWRTGRTGQFAPGNVSHNTGKPMPTRGRSAETQFRRGERRGAAVRLYKAIGTERLSKEGYLERKVNNDLPLQARWKQVHRINWEADHGPVPTGHALKCLDGNRLNVESANWRLISRALLPRLNGGTRGKLLAFDGAAEELKPLLLAAAELHHAAKVARRRNG